MTFAMKLYVRTKRLGNSIFVESNIKLFIEFINDNLSQKFVEHATFSFQPRETASLSSWFHILPKLLLRSYFQDIVI